MNRSNPASPAEIRRLARAGEWAGTTVGHAPDYVQANLVILNRELAYDFLLFCQRNPKPCPLLEVTEIGSPLTTRVAAGADLRTDLPLYRIFRDGALVEEVRDITAYWTGDMIGFLLGCSLTFEDALQKASIPVRHLDVGSMVAVFTTNIECAPAGVFSGPMVVSMRPIPGRQVAKAVSITGRYPISHGAPVHIGDPAAIGIADLSKPDFGDPVPIYRGETPVFWACGVTPQAVAMRSRPALMITHAPGYMFVTDYHADELQEA